MASFLVSAKEFLLKVLLFSILFGLCGTCAEFHQNNLFAIIQPSKAHQAAAKKDHIHSDSHQFSNFAVSSSIFFSNSEGVIFSKNSFDFSE